VRTAIRNKIKEWIGKADLICYPPGSFYSSVVANLLADGVGRAVAANTCPKIFVPSTGEDPETPGMSVADRAEVLCRHLHADAGAGDGEVLGYILVDSKNGRYAGGVDRKRLEERGFTVIEAPLVTGQNGPDIDGRALSEFLLSLC
jgi:hypothetical protein